MTSEQTCPTCMSPVTTAWNRCGYCGSELVSPAATSSISSRKAFPAWLAIAIGGGIALSIVLVLVLQSMQPASDTPADPLPSSSESSIPDASATPSNTPSQGSAAELPFREPPQNLARALANSGGNSASEIQRQLLAEGICKQELTKAEFFDGRESSIYYEQWDADLVRECIAEGPEVSDFRWVTIFVGDEQVSKYSRSQGILGNQIRIFGDGWALQTTFTPGPDFEPIQDDPVVSSIYKLLGGSYVQP